MNASGTSAESGTSCFRASRAQPARELPAWPSAGERAVKDGSVRSSAVMVCGAADTAARAGCSVGSGSVSSLIICWCSAGPGPRESARPSLSCTSQATGWLRELRPPVANRMGMAMKFDYEAAVTRRLFDVVALPFADLANLMAKYGRETGADVEVRVGGRIVVIQVTDFSGDEGAADPRRGLRARESRNATQGKYPAYAIPLQHQPTALRLRVSEKVVETGRYRFEEFGEVWLLIAASVARPDAVVSTLILPQFVSVEDLNRDLTEELRASKYTRAFLYIVVGETVYEWTRATGWQLIHGTGAAQSASGGARPTGERAFPFLPRFP